MKRRIVIDLDIKCDTLKDSQLEDHVEAMIDEMIYSIDEITYCYEDDSDQEHVVRTTSDHQIKNLD